ncbi:UDP-N-acetylglucosamine--N-acetylmuramyl-(pentapeptide) pyrophosphoryl-undecaprenol N-acetylglucosamine transferase [Hyella patelloides LEGE 07179]|uniref:UDP-N-acetylglucosamine--N-acetylmuramyl-(pentapeptide) pyrophosphoryl-undecaprenol N-acetylglucosamine transferase n=1 Tax=Hyella patelloides LEGE 07179 TaxID=945734 RepID=A0A563VXJ8_9CYAN|nr:undecaprenyldiphospho-muramoylpentapeptide beta-N-acetylglucosaminyltransferase [Hyella patelloides]VEP16178.1 UDP-N-acetylglucosamine--N-acetylmuramyl-(pentapeptide) pyrophosphoryl-undecaprenol N-acetylglucosamine transferase [Hyella patelloides LEGE 07179]
MVNEESKPIRLLIAASGTGGHLFPALAVAEQLSDYEIQWLGVPNRLENTLVPESYPLNIVKVEGLQQRLGIKTIKIAFNFVSAIFQVQKLIREQQIDGVFTTGGYIAAPAILAAKLQNKPAILHESNFIPGKVTRFLSRWCSKIALGFRGTAQYLPQVTTEYVSTPVRSQFLTPQNLDLAIPDNAILIVVAGGSQGAVAVNQLVREVAPNWLDKGAYMVHLTGNNDPDVESLNHPHYIHLPFYDNMAGLLQRANLAISRAGAGTLTELAITGTPAILIPYPYAAEDHQTFNAKVFVEAGAAVMYPQASTTAEILQNQVDRWLETPETLQAMATKAQELAIADSATQLANSIRSMIPTEINIKYN